MRFLEAGVRPARTPEIFPLFPATLTDVYGPRHATVNYGFLYVSQGIGAPIAALIRETTGSWTLVFLSVAVIDAAVAIATMTVPGPARARWIAREIEELSTEHAAVR